MDILGRLTSQRRNVAITAVLIVALAMGVRFLNIGWAFSTNGIDEGIMLERAHLVASGYEPYKSLPLDQAPLALLIGGDIWGNVEVLRVFVAAVSVLAVVACMESARRIRGNAAMLITGALIAVDFAFLRESRLFSLNSLSSSVMAVSILLFVLYVQKNSRLALVSAGVLVGVAASMKLFGVLGFVGMAIFLGFELMRPSLTRRKGGTDLVLLSVSAALPVIMLMLYLGPSQMLEGMVFNQGHRPFEPVQKLSFLPYFGTNLAYMLPLFVGFRRLWKSGPELRFLLWLTVAVVVFMLAQPLMYYHHLVMLSPALSILAGVFVVDLLEHRKEQEKRGRLNHGGKRGLTVVGLSEAAVVAGLLISAGLAGYGLATQGTPTQQLAADKIAAITGPNDLIVSGDPIISAYADRLTPPSLVNVAYSRYPDLSLEEVESGILDNNVKVVVLAYRLNSMQGLEEFLATHGFSEVSRDYFGYGDGTAIYTFNRAIEPFSFYVRDDIVSAFGLPVAP